MKNSLKTTLNQFIENYFYEPKLIHKLLAILLWPLSLIYSLIASFNARAKEQFASDILVISVGNLTVGGSNKSPFSRALAEYLSSEEFYESFDQNEWQKIFKSNKPLRLEQIALVLRGYKRKSHGLLRVQDFTNPINLKDAFLDDSSANPLNLKDAFLDDSSANPLNLKDALLSKRHLSDLGDLSNNPAVLKDALKVFNPLNLKDAYELYGDEACEHKMLLNKLEVIVSKDRIKAIKYAASIGAKVVILDDAFAKFNIKKFDYLLEHEHIKYLPFCLPSGPLRLCRRYKNKADFIARANIDYEIISSVPKRLNECFLLTSIARPNRLANIARQCAGSLALSDHSLINEAQITKKMLECNARRLICTGKDAVKLNKLKCEIIGLRIHLKPAIKAALINYIKDQNV